MPHYIVLGAGITGVTTARALLRRGHQVTIVERNRYPAMETSFANGGQLSASNAEVWNSWATVLKGIRWMLRANAPLLLHPRPGLHKYGWLAEFMAHIPDHDANTVETVRLALLAREHLFRIAGEDGIAFDLERRGILHFYHDMASFRTAEKANRLLVQGGLERHAVTPEEIRSIEPALQGTFAGGFHTPSDCTGDIHKFTRGLAEACARLHARFLFDTTVTGIQVKDGGGVAVALGAGRERLEADGVVICAGVHSRHFAAMLGDRVNIYPVKGYSITVHLPDAESRRAAPWTSLLDEDAKIVTSRLGADRFRVAGTAEFNGFGRDIRADRVDPLMGWCRRLFPGMATDKVVPWAGLRPMTPNMLPRVGRGRKPGIYYNAGHGHLGWTLSAATAEILAQAIAPDDGR